MIDYDDVEFVGLFAPIGVISIIVLLIMFYMAYNNNKECKEKVCPVKYSAVIVKDSCVCLLNAE